MSGFLKRYKIQMEILTPVFIASGDELAKNEYIFYKNNQHVWIPDKQRLIKDIYKRKLENSFEQYMMEGKQAQPLLNWMKSNGYKEKEILDLCSYHMDCSKALDNLNRPVGILEFVKDAYGLPYVPGSSLKGALRTALLGARILDNPKKYADLQQEVLKAPNILKNRKPDKKYLVSQGKKAEVVAFHTLKNAPKKIEDAKNDELKGIHISDSLPLPLESLILCQKIDMGLGGKKSSLNILRECLKPKTVVEFELTIDTSVCKITKEEIEQALQKTYDFYREVYVKKFLKQQAEEKGNLYLGGGCGFGTKTITYELLPKEQGAKVIAKLMENKFPKHAHRADAQKGVSPHMLKCTNYNGSLCEMGKCHIQIKA